MSLRRTAERSDLCVQQKTLLDELGTRHQFQMRFESARAFSDTGLLGVWKPIGNVRDSTRVQRPRHRK